MKRLVCLTLLLLLTLPAAAEKSPDFGSLDRGRRADHERTFNQLKDLNLIRMKMLSIQNSLTRLTRTWSLINLECGGRVTADIQSDCLSRTANLIDDANLQQQWLVAFRESSTYKELISKPPERQIGFRDFIVNSINSLDHLLTTARNYRHSLGLQVTENEWRKALPEMRNVEASARLTVQCGLTPVALKDKLVAAMTLRLRSDSESDAYLILKGDAMAVEVRDAAEQLSPKRQAQRAVLVAIGASSLDLVARTPPMDHVRELIGKDCERIESKASAELVAACKLEDVSVGMLDAISREMRRQEAGK